jgi:Protein of unknown function with HXXEE motif
MNFLRKNWFDVGGFLAVIILIYLYFNYLEMSNYQIVMWLSLVSLLLHQLEEYRIVGTFPGVFNSALFNSETPDRYPLNMNTSLYVNVFLGWFLYLLAALVSEKAIWLGIATILVSFGNTIAHTTLFNIKGKTLYNAGLATSWLFFAPCVYYFFSIIHSEHLVTTMDYLISIPLGFAFNYFGIVKLINWMKDKNSPYPFPNRCLLPKDRK